MFNCKFISVTKSKTTKTEVNPEVIKVLTPPDNGNGLVEFIEQNGKELTRILKKTTKGKYLTPEQKKHQENVRREGKELDAIMRKNPSAEECQKILNVLDSLK